LRIAIYAAFQIVADDACGSFFPSQVALATIFNYVSQGRLAVIHVV
jgi:hypothetical protein